MSVNERNKKDYYKDYDMIIFMRLSKYYVDSIRTVFNSIFKEGTVYLFGSRVDDTKKVGI